MQVGVGLVVSGGLYFALDFFRDAIFARIKQAADPSASSEEFDFEALQKWNQIEMIFDLMFLLLLSLPAFLACQSSWKFWLQLSLPRFRKRASFLRASYARFEVGYRLSNLIRAVREKNWLNVASNASILAALFSSSKAGMALVLGFLFLRQICALWQSLYTILQLDARINRRYFSLVVNGAQAVLLTVACLAKHRSTLFANPAAAVAIAVYLFQLGRGIYGFFK